MAYDSIYKRNPKNLRIWHSACQPPPGGFSLGCCLFRSTCLGQLKHLSPLPGFVCLALRENPRSLRFHPKLSVHMAPRALRPRLGASAVFGWRRFTVRPKEDPLVLPQKMFGSCKLLLCLLKWKDAKHVADCCAWCEASWGWMPQDVSGDAKEKGFSTSQIPLSLGVLCWAPPKACQPTKFRMGFVGFRSRGVTWCQRSCQMIEAWTKKATAGKPQGLLGAILTF